MFLEISYSSIYNSTSGAKISGSSTHEAPINSIDYFRRSGDEDDGARRYRVDLLLPLNSASGNVGLNTIMTGSCEERTDGKLATYIMSLELRVNYLTLGNVPHGIRWSDDLSCALLAFG